MSTSGDEGAPSVDVPGGLKGLFVDTILDALEREEIDVAVHSAKDLPAEDEDGLVGRNGGPKAGLAPGPPGDEFLDLRHRRVRVVVKKRPKTRSQISHFRKAARKLGCDESEARFDAALPPA